MEHSKSPRPDGFPIEFYQRFWDPLKWYLRKKLDDFHKGNINMARLNYNIITLTPKTKDAKKKLEV